MKEIQKLDLIYKIILTIMIFTYIVINIFVKHIFSSSYTPFIQVFIVVSYVFIAKPSKSIVINSILICLTVILFIISILLMVS